MTVSHLKNVNKNIPILVVGSYYKYVFNCNIILLQYIKRMPNIS